jgi:putative hydrolase of the HAD superfamily
MLNIVFDFGAVLLNWQPGVLVQAHFPELSRSYEQRAALAHAVFGHPDWHSFDRGVLSAPEVCARAAARLGLGEPALRALIDDIAEHLQPMPESVAVLEQLRALRDQKTSDLRLYFLSNMPVPYARFLEQKHAFIKWFDGGIFSGDVRHIKPEPEIYKLLETRYRLEPARTLFVDDLASNVAHAQRRGWQGIHFESAAQLREQLQRVLEVPLS